MPAPRALNRAAFLVCGLTLALPGTALAASPSKALALNGSGKSASSQTVSVAANGTETLTWKENQGAYALPTGSNVMASRIIAKVSTKITGTGRRRKRVKVTTRVAQPITVYSVSGSFVNEVVSATTSAGVTTVAWGVNDPTGNKVTLMARRIDARGKLSPIISVSPAGTRAHEMRLVASPSGRSTLVWRSDDTFVSWVEAKQIDKAGSVGSLISVSPSHGAFHDMEAAGRSNGSVDVVWRNGNGLRPITQVVQIGAGGTVGSPIDLGTPGNSSNDDQAISMSVKGVSTIAWTEYNSTLDKNILRMTRLSANGVHSSTLDLTNVGSPYLPAVGVAADGTGSVAWLYGNETASRVRMIRVSPKGAVGRVLDLGPSRESLIQGLGPSLTVAGNGLTTLVWSVVQPKGFPAPVYLQAIRVDAKGVKGRPTTIVAPNGNLPDLAHYPVIASAADGTSVLAFVRHNVYGSASRLNLINWK